MDFYRFIFLVYFLLIKEIQCLFDPISISVGVGLTAAGYFNYDFIKEQTYCRYKECCTPKYIPANTTMLDSLLTENLFGQHIVHETVLAALKSHYTITNSKKPLVMSFHGTPGTGKNYVSDFIAKAIFRKGLESSYYHKFVGRMDFPLEHMVNVYKVELKERIIKEVKRCPASIFVFDEVDKMPKGIFDSIVSLLDHHYLTGGVNFRKAVFIFLSNHGGVEIAMQLKGLIDSGTWRENTKLHNFESQTELSVYNRPGGLQGSATIESHVIDHFIPFLPLEKRHVIKCIEAEMRRMGFSITEENINKVLDYVTYDSYNLFANSGCKRLSKKVEALF